MIIPDNKKAVTVILSKHNNGQMKDAEQASEESLEGDAFKVIAEDILLAVSNKSPHDLSVALKALCSHMQAMDEEEDPSDY